MAYELNNSNFKDFVEKSEVPVLVDFWAPWCGPCKMLGPIVEQISKEYEGKIKVGKVNVDENQELSVEFGVVSIPTIYIFNKGKSVQQAIGFKSKDALINLFKDLI